MKIEIESNAISIIVVFVLVAVTGAFLYQIYSPKTGITGNAPNAGDLNVFKGIITNANLASQRLDGRATTDNGCGGVGNGLVECNTDITTSQGTINFKYRHNMNVQPCLAMSGPENVVVNILDSNGNAEVVRTQSTGSMH